MLGVLLPTPVLVSGLTATSYDGREREDAESRGSSAARAATAIVESAASASAVHA